MRDTEVIKADKAKTKAETKAKVRRLNTALEVVRELEAEKVAAAKARLRVIISKAGLSSEQFAKILLVAEREETKVRKLILKTIKAVTAKPVKKAKRSHENLR